MVNLRTMIFWKSCILTLVASGISCAFGYEALANCEAGFRQSFIGQSVYYAHPLSLYDTPGEKVDIRYLETLGFKVLNPNDDAIEAMFQTSQDFGLFVRLAKSTDAVAVRAFPDGKLSAGVVKEALSALEQGHLVFEIPTTGKGEIHLLSQDDINQRALDIPQTIMYLNRIGVVEKIKY